MSFYCISAANDDLKTYFKGLLPDQHHNEQSVLVSDYIKTSLCCRMTMMMTTASIITTVICSLSRTTIAETMYNKQRTAQHRHPVCYQHIYDNETGTFQGAATLHTLLKHKYLCTDAHCTMMQLGEYPRGINMCTPPSPSFLSCNSEIA